MMRGYIDRHGDQVIPFNYTDGVVFSNGVARVKSGNQYGFINHRTRPWIPFQYDEGDPMVLPRFAKAIIGDTSISAALN
jgi:hypothetical protein